MSKLHLDSDLLEKLAKKTAKSKQYIREQISRKAGRLGISSVAAQIVWAKEQSIGVTHALNKLPSEVREEVRVSKENLGSPRPPGKAISKPSRSKGSRTSAISAGVIDSILQDKTLRDRCRNLLQGKKHFDQVFREATTVLDDRLKAKTGIKKMKPVDLVGKALNPDPQRAIIEVSSDRDEQEGFHSVCKGTMLFFRNRAHHALSDEFTREEALKFCGFIDTILDVIEQAQVHQDRVPI